jgi:DNA-binding XRE family transcriptional regulator
MRRRAHKPGVAQRRREERLGQYRTRAYREVQRTLAANALRLRVAAGWTQEETAARCDMGVRLYQQVEHGDTNATVTTLARLCAGFRVELAELARPVPKAPRPKR